LILINCRHAFDSVKLPLLWKLLDKTSKSKKCIHTQRYLWWLQSFRKNWPAGLGRTRPINILKGVKHGDVLSAMLFCIVIADIALEAD